MTIVDSLHPFEHFLVQADVVSVLGEYRTHLLRQLVHVVVGLGTEHIVEHRGGSPQEIVVVLVVFWIVVAVEGVLECRLGRGVDDYLQLFFLAAYAFHHGLLVVGQGDFVERNGIVGCVVGVQERVFMRRSFH